MSLSVELELALRLFVALALGAAIGLEREFRGHPAGLRTMALVSMGSCMFSLLGFVYTVHGQDPTRIAAQVVTGIGFLGAGTILRAGGGVYNLTTAATIWVVAAIGMGVGFGVYLLPIMATVMVLFALVIMRAISERFVAPRRVGKIADEE